MALRRFRFPVPARVRVEQGRPVRVVTDRRGLSGGAVQQWAGPWRTSGGWWMQELAHRCGPPEADRQTSTGLSGRCATRPGEGGWNHDEWDVALSDGATYRVFRERDTDQWFVEGVVD